MTDKELAAALSRSSGIPTVQSQPQQMQQTQTGGTSAPSPNRTDAEVLAAKIEGRKATDAYMKQHEATSGRMRDSGTRRAFYDKALAEDYALTEKIKNSDIRDIMAGINGYERAASNYAKAISARDNLLKGNPTEAALVGGIYDNDINQAQKQMDNLSKALGEFGIEVDGNLVNANKYYEKYFDNLKGYAQENNAPSVYLPQNGLFEYSVSTDLNKDIGLVQKDEMQLYNYLATRDKDAADAYRQYLTGQIEQRKGQARAEEIQGMYNGPEKAVVRGVEALKSGLAGTYNAAMATATGRDMNTSASQYAADILRTELQNQGKTTLGFDAMQSIGGMIPGVVAGLANPIAGAAVFGATSGASGYQQKLAEGWSKQDAAAYGVLTGASEALLGKFLGGIPSLGGKIGGVMAKALPKIDNAIGRVVARVGGEAFSEAREEVIQAILEPAIATIVGNVDFDAPNAEELIYTALIGAVTSVGLGAPGAISEISRPTTSGLNTDSGATTTNPILDAKSLDEVVSATQTRDNMDVASAKVRSDEGLMGELQNTVGRQLSNSNDVKLAIAELQMKAAVEQKLSAAVAEGTPQAIEKALMEIASNPRELNILNKYYGNLPGTVEGNIEFAKKVANGQAVAKTTEATTPAKVDEGQEVRNIIDQMAGIAPVTEEAIQSPAEAQEDVGVQVTPDATQEAEQAASERLNQQALQQANADGTMNTENVEGGDKNGQREIRRYSDAGANEEVQDAAYARGIDDDKGAQGSLLAATYPGTERGVFGDERGTQSKVSGKVAQALGRNETFGTIRRPAEKVINGLGLARPTHESVIRRANGKPVYEVVSFNDDTQYIADWFKENDIPALFFYGESEDIFGGVIGYYSPSENAVFLDVSDPDLMRTALHEAIHYKLDVSGVNFVEEYFELQRHLSDDIMDALDAEEASIAESYGFTEEEYIPEGIGYYMRFGESEEDAFYYAYEDYWEDLTQEFMAFVGSSDLHTSFSKEGINLVLEVRKLLVDSGVVPEEFFDLELAYTEKLNAQLESRYDSSEKDHATAHEETGIESSDELQQPPPSRASATDEAEYTALLMDEEREAANSDMQLQQQMYETKQQVNSSGQYTQQQRDAKQAAQRQREQEGIPKYDVAHEYGSDTVAKFSDFDSRIGNLVDEQRVFEDGKAEGTKVAKSVSRLNNGKEILNMARAVMRGDLSIQDFANEYYAIENSASSYLYSKDIADALREAVLDVSPTRNTDYTQVTQVKKAKDVTVAMQMLVHRAEKAAEYKIVSSNLSKQIRTSKNKASGVALARYFNVQATPDTFFKALGGFNREGNSEAYALADEALENNATEKRERSAGYSFFTDVTKHKDFEAFAKNKLMSGYVANSVELTAQEAVSLLHSLRSIREQTKNYSEGYPDSITIDRDGKSVTIASISGRNDLRNLEEEIESHITGIAKEYSEALDKMFAHYSPKFLNAIKDSTGLDREAAPEGKYFPLFYRDGGDGATFNIAEALQSRFEKLGFAKERTGPGSALQISPAAQVADNYIAQVSHYIGWASFSSKLNMLNSNIDGTGSFLSTIADVYSPNAANLMADYIRDVGGYKTSDSDNWFNQLLGRFAGAVITGRPSTAFSQLSSVYAAGGIIKPEAIRQSGVIFPVKRKHVNLDDGLLTDRARHGMNDSTISEITRNADSKIKNAIEKIPGGKKYLNLVGIADAYTTKQLYAACWCDVRMDYPDVQNSNPKLFDTLVEDKFTEAILFSQSDADRINNAALYRGDGAKGSIMRALSMFTGQPNKQLNMVMTALGEYNAAKGDAKKEAAKTLANTVRGQAGAAVSYAMLKTVASLVLHKWYDFKDEEEELDLGEVARSALSESISTFTGMLWFGETVSDKFMYAISDGKWGNNFEFQVNGVSQLFNLADSVTNALGIVNGDVPTAKEIKDLAMNVANVTGAPIQGAYDFVNALALWGVDAYNGIVKGEKPKANYDIAKYIDKQVKAKKKAETQAAKEAAKAEAAAAKEAEKQEQDAIDMLINAGKAPVGDIETIYGKTTAEIDAINKEIDVFKKEKKDEYDSYGNNAIVDIILDAGLTDDGIDALVKSNTSSTYRSDYNAMREFGLSPQEAIDTYLSFDSDKNGNLKQRELQDAYLEDNGLDNLVAAIWGARTNWSTPWESKKGK